MLNSAHNSRLLPLQMLNLVKLVDIFIYSLQTNERLQKEKVLVDLTFGSNFNN